MSKKKKHDEHGPYSPTAPVDDWESTTPVDDSVASPATPEEPTTPVDEPEASTTPEPTTPVDEEPASSSAEEPATPVVKTVTLEIEVSERTLALLAVLSPVTRTDLSDEERAAETLTWFADYVWAGISRPGSWERGWLVRAFGDDFVGHLERDPANPDRMRPRPPPQTPASPPGSVVEGAPGP